MVSELCFPYETLYIAGQTLAHSCLPQISVFKSTLYGTAFSLWYAPEVGWPTDGVTDHEISSQNSQGLRRGTNEMQKVQNAGYSIIYQ